MYNVYPFRIFFYIKYFPLKSRKKISLDNNRKHNGLDSNKNHKQTIGTPLANRKHMVAISKTHRGPQP
ncbi:hypothetical protein NQ317_011309 [Molorchus minor]|uniref:Uncharacterized protein n=1 Tax=Molorchus minor TaxID=1323400 RepID=A0ABQ9IZ09_9CUCU|nr:hypothetical protein NQ317_011309 [Molorchus minor]